MLLLSACSTTTLMSGKASNRSNTFNELQKEYNNYQYSNYVKNSLAVVPAPIAERVTSTLDDRKLKAVTRQLTNRKKRSAAHLNGVRNQNGIYKPSRSLQQQIARLNTNKKAE